MQNKSDLRRQSADTVRFLAVDAVQKANSGHPGMPMGMADAAVVLWTEAMDHNPKDPSWFNRDRFVLSAGHGSMLLYSLLHLSGYGLSMEDLQNFRQWGSKTPGHPEFGHTIGVETTTGPLGQGLSNAVGLALAERHLAATFNTPEHKVIDHYTYVIASDGDLQEGVTHEACAFAGHVGLGKLIVLWDDNGISIDGPTSLSFSENVLQRYRAYGWQVQSINGHDPNEVALALRQAQRDKKRPSIIACKTHIGFGSPHKQDSSGAHGSPLGADEIKLTKQNLGWDPEKQFYVPDGVYDYMRQIESKGKRKQVAWNKLLRAYRAVYPQKSALLEKVMAEELPRNWDAFLPIFEQGTKLATREASGKVLEALKQAIPQLIGGSADLTPSNNTRTKADESFSRENPQGRYLHFGIREHGMGAIANGVTLHGGLKIYTGTFLAFADYMRPTLRLAALMNIPSIFVFTHDSIGLGEDGPTHQPVEQVMSLRCIPNLITFRPADAAETVAAWKFAITSHQPVALALTRQAMPVTTAHAAQHTKKGGYVVLADENPDVLLLGTGSELSLAVEAAQKLQNEGIRAQVVSLPSWELFEAQPKSYRDTVLPPSVKARVAVEAGIKLGWERYIGIDGAFIGMKGYGASAPANVLYEKFGITTDAIVEAAKSQIGR
jgi:transketolase